MSDEGKHSKHESGQPDQDWAQRPPPADPRTPNWVINREGEFIDNLHAVLKHHALDEHVGVPAEILAEHVVNHLDCLKETNDAVKRYEQN